MTDSSTGGYLIQDGALPGPLEDAVLDDFMHDLVAGVTGIDNKLVMPRWQEEPPNLPPKGTDWCAFGIPTRRTDTYPVISHDPSAAGGEGADVLVRHEELDLLCSFYGPNNQGNATKLRDGMGIAQNREPLLAAGMGLVSVGEPTKAPELIKNTWVGRSDLTVVIKRAISREYPVRNVVSAEGTIDTETVTTAFNTAS